MNGDENQNLTHDLQLDAIMAVVPALLKTMEALGYVARHLHPPHLAALLERVADIDGPLREGLGTFNEVEWPEHLSSFKGHIESAGNSVCLAFDGLREAAQDPNGIIKAYRSLRFITRANEALYPLSTVLSPVSRFFLEDTARQDEELIKRFETPPENPEQVGILHISNEKKDRGGFSLYVPETYDPLASYPVVIALHGGSGHGRDFLWTWLREARSRGMIVISPSSIDTTWALMGPDPDATNIRRMLTYVGEHWNVDLSQVLLTGMSDGGTYTYLDGLQTGAPYTHLAPVSASFHPMLIEAADAARVKDLPVAITHGALDWMFSIDMAHGAHHALEAAGADVHLRAIEDLSHTYPRDENETLADWFLGQETK